MDTEILSKYPILQTKVNGLNYAYIKEGKGKPILFLHGFPDLATTWDRTIEELSKNYCCIAPFLLGYYPTDIAKDGDYNPKRIAEDLVALMTQLGIDEFFVVGHDWGASVAYALANLCPEKVTKLVIEAIPHPSFIKPSLKLLFKARHFLALRSERSSQFAKKGNY